MSYFDDEDHDRGSVGDSIVSVYRFTWENGTSRTTDEIEDAHLVPDVIEALADCGRQDPECTVERLGFSS